MLFKLIILSAALLVDRFVGDPPALWRSIPHPVVLFGKAIGWGERRWNRPDVPARELERRGMWLMIGLIAASAIFGIVIERFLQFHSLGGFLVKAIIVAIFLAQKSLADHVHAVADGLKTEGIEGGRRAVSMIVGRNPEHLDEGGVSRAAIESLAENASDGVVAPAFWFFIGGLPGLFAYKMINTADSMIAHLNDRYRHFGKFAALIDDIANFIPARLTGFLAVGAAFFLRFSNSAQKNGIARRALTVMLKDARLHRSPNAGWPEAAFAGALNLALAGPRRYGDDVVDEPMLNSQGRREVNAADISAALKLFWIAMNLLCAITIIIAGGWFIGQRL